MDDIDPVAYWGLDSEGCVNGDKRIPIFTCVNGVWMPGTYDPDEMSLQSAVPLKSPCGGGAVAISELVTKLSKKDSGWTPEQIIGLVKEMKAK